MCFIYFFISGQLEVLTLKKFGIIRIFGNRNNFLYLSDYYSKNL